MGQIITIEIPDYAINRRCTFFLGRECFVVRDENGDIYQKKIRCNLCGDCCKNPSEGWKLGTQQIDGETYCAKIKKTDGKFECIDGGEVFFCLFTRDR